MCLKEAVLINFFVLRNKPMKFSPKEDLSLGFLDTEFQWLLKHLHVQMYIRKLSKVCSHSRCPQN